MRPILCLLLTVLAVGGALGQEAPHAASPEVPYHVGAILLSDDFSRGLEQWNVELEKGGTVQARDGKLVIDVPAGCTCWFKPKLQGPVMIQYDATAVSAGGPNDRVSDLNCFWMAHVPDGNDLSAGGRSGKFSAYDTLLTYYVGLGGNGNTTTRFRRYVGEPGHRPLLPEHDRQDPPHLLTANASQTLRLVAYVGLIQFYRDAERIFELTDADPYTSGWFAVRTVDSHLEIRNFRVYRLIPDPR